MQRLGMFGATAVSLAVAIAAAACSTPPVAGGTIGLGVHSGTAGGASVTFQYDGTAGELLNVGLELSGAPTPPVYYYPTVQSPDGTTAPLVRSGCLGESQVAQCGTFSLPVTGRYSVIVAPNTSNAPHASFALTLSHDQHLGPVPFGTLLPASILLGQEITYIYAGTADESLNVAGTLRSPSGTQVNHTDGTYTLPATGTYTLALRRKPGALSHDLDGGAIGLGATTMPPHLPAQRVVFTYAGTAGEVLGLAGGVSLFDPNGDPVPRVCCRAVERRRQLTMTGPHMVRVSATTVTAYLTHYFEGGPIGLGGTTVPSRLPGQWARFTYQGTAAEAVGIAGVIEIRDPTGALVHPPTGGSSNGRRLILPATGIYSVITEEDDTVWLQHDVDGGPIGLGTTSVPALAPGAPIAYRYDGVTGQRLRVEVYDSYAAPDLELYRPDGSLVQRWSRSIEGTLNLSGEYTLVVVPWDDEPPAYRTLTLTLVP